jgi:hypothetical protein
VCDAYARIPDLDLKFVVHHGSAIYQEVAGHQELLGSDVIVVHRLLKNDVVEKELAKDIAPAYGAALEAAMPALIDQLEAEYAARIADRRPEPELDLRR